MNATQSPDKTPDRGYMGDTRRGASMGRVSFDSRDPAAVAELRRQADSLETAAGYFETYKADRSFYLMQHLSDARDAELDALAAARRSEAAELRATLAAIEAAPPVLKLHLNRVRLDSGGYDSGGAYWGHGGPLYVAYDDAGLFQEFTRAWSRSEAQREILADNDGVTFYASRWDH